MCHSVALDSRVRLEKSYIFNNYLWILPVEVNHLLILLSIPSNSLLFSLPLKL